MMQQDEKGRMWQVLMSNLQGQGEPKVTRIQKAFAKRTDERLARLAAQVAAVEETL